MVHLLDLQRLIPAWAGKTPRFKYSVLSAPAHPRVGGENASALPAGGRSSGSSPRGRGKLHVLDEPGEQDRLIPAWAGKTRSGPGRSRRPGAHPRVGGENALLRDVFLSENGSSPRGRGKLVSRSLRGRRRRLIPAWAGKTEYMHATYPDAQAHPRVGGENRSCQQRPRR